MITALWIGFWVLAVLLASLVFSLVIAALIRVGSGGDQDLGVPRPAPPPTMDGE